MDRDERLATVLAEFARTMLTDFPIQGILDRLVERIVDVLPVDAAGVTLISGGHAPHLLAASDDAARSLERLQSSLGAGPCVTANGTGVAVVVPEVASDSRYPDFVAAARHVGVAAVFAFPLHHGDGRLGALDLFRSTTGPLDAWAMSAAQTLADVAAAYVLNAQAREAREAASEQLLAASLHDSLTGLPNRAMLQERLDHAAVRAQRTLAPAAVLFADLDGFKQVNDTHGHPVGDALLVAVGRRLSGLLRPGDTLARVSGDEFVILCEDLRVVEDVDALVVRIGEAFQRPFSVTADVVGSTPVELQMSASVGIAFAGRADRIGPGLIQEADRAMYLAKRRSATVSRVVVDVPVAARAAGRLQLQRDLRDALELGRLTLAYQPIVRCSDGSVTDVEALLRWDHPEHGPVSPGTVVRLAEQNALIADLGQWVLERSLRDRAQWLSEDPERPLGLAVNVSCRQLLPGLPGTVARLLGETDMPAAQLTLEVPESCFLDDSAAVAAVLADLRALGVRLALDDFSSGHSSLGVLRGLPIDVVKIDPGFVAELGVDPAGGVIVQAVTGLAHVLGLQVTAEGVETAQQRDEVAAVGCDSAQGVHFAGPMSAAELVQAVQEHRGDPLRLPEARPAAD